MNNNPIHNNNKTNQFIPPSEEQIKKQFAIKGCNDQKQPLLFMAHYESNGWMVGKTKMRSWRAAVAGWILRIDQFKPKSFNKEPDTIATGMNQQLTPQQQADLEQIQRAYRNQRQ